jgi:hypothetical protein
MKGRRQSNQRDELRFAVDEADDSVLPGHRDSRRRQENEGDLACAGGASSRRIVIMATHGSRCLLMTAERPDARQIPPMGEENTPEEGVLRVDRSGMTTMDLGGRMRGMIAPPPIRMKAAISRDRGTSSRCASR